jgi:hypothetical protein
MRSVSQIPSLPFAICLNGFLSECIKFAGVGVSLEGRAETIGFERFKPSAKASQLAGRQLLDGFFDFFSGCHTNNMTPQFRGRKIRPVLNPPAYRQ